MEKVHRCNEMIQNRSYLSVHEKSWALINILWMNKVMSQFEKYPVYDREIKFTNQSFDT